jgi:hypothetical protein
MNTQENPASKNCNTNGGPFCSNCCGNVRCKQESHRKKALKQGGGGAGMAGGGMVGGGMAGMGVGGGFQQQTFGQQAVPSGFAQPQQQPAYGQQFPQAAAPQYGL